MDWTYLISDFVLLLIWIFLFLNRKDLRREMLLVSLIISLSSVTEVLFYGEYWTPIINLKILGTNFGIESILFCFSTGGIGAVIYETIFKKRISKAKEKFNFKAAVVIAFGTAVFLFLKFVVGLDTMSAWLIPFSICLSLMLYIRKDLVLDGLLSGVFFMLIYCFLLATNIIFRDSIETWWSVQMQWNKLVLGIPLGEIVWAFTWGALTGAIYEFIFSKKLKK